MYVTTDQLAAPDGASLIGFKRDAGIARTVEQKLHDSISAKDFGAVGNGVYHPLSERYATLGDAQADYPFVTSLDQSLDWAGLQQAVNSLKQYPGSLEGPRGRLVIPQGRYILSDSLRLPNSIEIVGGGPSATIIDNQNHPLSEPLFVNAGVSVIDLVIRGLSLHGGTCGLKVEIPLDNEGHPVGEVSRLMMDHVSFALQTDKNLECNRLLQLSDFTHCTFASAPYGVYVAGWTSNAVNFYNCKFESHSHTHLHLRSAEAVSFYGGRFEAGGVAWDPANPRIAMDLDNVGAVSFHGVYFEAVHEMLLKETASRNGISFHDCHFTGAHDGTNFIPFRFQSDGIVTFGTNDWYKPSAGPAQMMLTGDNQNKLGDETSLVHLARSRKYRSFISPTVPVPATLKRDLIRFNRTNPSGATDNIQTLAGKLTVNAFVLEAGGFDKSFCYEYNVRVSAIGVASILCEIAPVTQLGNPRNSLMTVGVKANPTSTDARLEVTFTDLDPATAIGSSLQWRFEAMATFTDDQCYLDVQVA